MIYGMQNVKQQVGNVFNHYLPKCLILNCRKDD